MLELFAIETGTNILTRIVRQAQAALEWFGGRLDDIDAATQETLSQEPTGGAK